MHVIEPHPQIARRQNPRAQKKKRRVSRTVAVIACVLLSIPSALSFKMMTGVPFVRLPALSEQMKGVQIFDRNDRFVVTAKKDRNNNPIPLKNVSKDMVNAIIAGEDKSFYKHVGVDPAGIMRAMVTNIQAGQIVQGGSTITQQLVKSLYLNPADRTITRKLLEAFLSVDVDLCYSKERILETYLNQIYYGNGAYGIEQASWAYFNKPASRLNLAESAFLAGIVRAPSELGDRSNRSKAIARQHEVLSSMVECKFITRAQADSARQEKLRFVRGPHPLKHPYYVSQVLEMVKRTLGETAMWDKSIKVYTNIDPAAQKTAEETLTRGIRNAPAGVDQGALVSISTADGAVLAMVGGAGRYEKAQWNRAINPHTTGSSFKPFVYLAGLMTESIGPHSVLYDAPIAVPMSSPPYMYKPRNFDGLFYGGLTVRDALAYSRNVCAVWVGQQAGIENVADAARYAGITSPMEKVPSLALGSAAASPLDMASAYATLARSGVRIEPNFIRRIEDAKGNVLERFVVRPERTLPEEPCRQIVDAMRDVVTRGTGKKAYLSGIPVAGKTGTADKARDIWFIGMTPDVVTAVWGGNDDNRPIPGQHVTGGAVMAGIWHDYMQKYYRTHARPVIAFASPEQPLDKTIYVPPFTAFVHSAGDIATEVGGAIEDVVEGGRKHPHTVWRKFIRVFKDLF